MAFNPNLIIPDISFYQDDNNTPVLPDFQKMKAAGAVGVIIRAGQNTWIDPDFRYNWRAAREAGLPRGTYWFYDSRSIPSGQASLFVNIVGDDLPEMGYWLDLEENYGGAYRGWQNWKKCLTALRAIRGDSVGIYTAPAYWTRNRPTDWLELPFFGTFPLWIANYGVAQPAIPAPWMLDKTYFWQFTSKGDGLKYGVESLGLDLNYFNGTAADFRNRYGGATPPPDGGANMQYKVIWLAGVARRSRPATTNSYTGLKYDYPAVVDVVTDNIPDGDDPTNVNKKWVQFTDGYFGASEYPDSLGVPKTRMEKVTVPAPVPVPGTKPFSFKVDGFKQFTGELDPE